MKRLIKIGVPVLLLFLMSPTNLSVANLRQIQAASSKRIVTTLTYNSTAKAVQLAAETQEGPDSDQGAKTVDSPETNPNDNQTATDGITDSAVKTETETKKATTPRKPANDVKQSTATPAEKPEIAEPIESTIPAPPHNKLNFETILLNTGTWWLESPLNMKIWYVFFFTALILYLFKLNQFRRPLLFVGIIILAFYLESSVDPISAVFNIIPKTDFTFDLALIILGMAVFFSLFLGRFYCGWICPLGAIQELINPGTKTRMQPAMDTLLKYVKYLILLIFLYLAWRTGNNIWNDYEPIKTLVHFDGSSMAWLVLILTLIVSIFIERPFCRYVCPLGAILALTSRLAIFRMRTNATVCMVCGKCTDGDCPMNAVQSFNSITDLPEIDNAECIYCLRCQKVCQRSALHITAHRINRVKTL